MKLTLLGINPHRLCQFFSRVYVGHGKGFLCSVLQEQERQCWLRQWQPNVEQHFSTYHPQLWRQNGAVKVSAWFGACLILPELTHLAPYSLMKSIPSAMLEGMEAKQYICIFSLIYPQSSSISLNSCVLSLFIY